MNQGGWIAGIVIAAVSFAALRAGGGGHYGTAATEAADAQMSLGW